MTIRNEIDKNSVIPIYHQIAENIKSYIQKGDTKIGTLIPSEHELCDIFEVSRMTIRKSIDTLVHEGILVRKKGKGTFVCTPKRSLSRTSLTNFSRDMVEQGMVPTSFMLSLKVIPTSEKVSVKLNIKEGERVICLERVRLADDNPHAYERSFLLYDYAKGILDMDFSHHSLYDALVHKCNVKMEKAKEVIEATVCPSKISAELQIPLNTVTFYMERITYTENNCPFEYVESYYRTDKFKFYVELDFK